MSWVEIKKAVNSELTTPLNHLLWMNDYKTYGNNSYVKNIQNIYDELMHSPISLRDKSVRMEAIDYLNSVQDDEQMLANVALFLGEEELLTHGNLETMCADYDFIKANFLKTTNKEKAQLFWGSQTFRSRIGNANFMNQYFNDKEALKATYNLQSLEAREFLMSNQSARTAAKNSSLVTNVSGSVSWVNSASVPSGTTMYSGAVFIVGFSQSYSSNSNPYSLIYDSIKKESLQMPTSNTYGSNGDSWQPNIFSSELRVCACWSKTSGDGSTTGSTTAYAKVIKL